MDHRDFLQCFNSFNASTVTLNQPCLTRMFFRSQFPSTSRNSSIDGTSQDGTTARGQKTYQSPSGIFSSPNDGRFRSLKEEIRSPEGISQSPNTFSSHQTTIFRSPNQGFSGHQKRFSAHQIGLSELLKRRPKLTQSFPPAGHRGLWTYHSTTIAVRY